MSDWLTLKNALNLTLRPIQDWPGKPHPAGRERGPFTAPMKDTLTTLKRELAALSAKNIVLQIALREQDLRQDGLPRAGAIATHPGIILAFDSRHGPLRLYFDSFTRWENNLRAVAMHLEHLRLAGLYGVGTDGQQYRGWMALPDYSSPDISIGAQTPEAAALLIGEAIARHALSNEITVSDILRDPKKRDRAFRIASSLAHPDNSVTGDQEQFLRLQQAKALLDKVYG